MNHNSRVGIVLWQEKGRPKVFNMCNSTSGSLVWCISVARSHAKTMKLQLFLMQKGKKNSLVTGLLFLPPLLIFKFYPYFFPQKLNQQKTCRFQIPDLPFRKGSLSGAEIRNPKVIRNFFVDSRWVADVFRCSNVPCGRDKSGKWPFSGFRMATRSRLIYTQ